MKRYMPPLLRDALNRTFAVYIMGLFDREFVAEFEDFLEAAALADALRNEGAARTLVYEVSEGFFGIIYEGRRTVCW